MSLSLKFYRHVLVPSALQILKIGVPLWGPKLQMMLDEREKAHYLPLSTAKTKAPFWIHCSSGEFEYAKPVIRALKQEFPDHSVVVTYMSPSVKSSVQNFSEVDIALPVPWDRPNEINAFLNAYHPAALLIARTDVWPELLTQLNERKIPSLLFSATLADESSRLKWPARIFSGLALSQLERIQCVTSKDKANFTRFLPPARIEVTGDTRYDQVQFRLHHPKTLRDELKPQNIDDPILVLGSTWPEDEAQWLKALPELFEVYPRLRLLWAPHEPEVKHLEELSRRLGNLGVPTRFYSNATQWAPGEALIIDEVGILADLYAWGNLAFVGGSFKKQVHSVMEPLAHGLCCILGPKHLNNREALHFKTQSLPESNQKVVTSASSAGELIKAVKALEPHWRQKASGTYVQSLVAAQSGATGAVISWCREKLQ